MKAIEKVYNFFSLVVLFINILHEFNVCIRMLNTRLESLTPRFESLTLRFESLTPRCESLTPRCESLTPRCELIFGKKIKSNWHFPTNLKQKYLKALLRRRILTSKFFLIATK